MTKKINRAWAEINLDNICHNVDEVKKHINNKEIMGVVKADGYGHGAVEISKTLLECGVSYLAVSMIDEAVELRKAGIEAPLLIFGYTDPMHMLELVKHDITQSIYEDSQAKELNDFAKKMKKKIKVHINIDTGMSRLGYRIINDNYKEIYRLANYKNLELEGVYTHLSVADERDDKFTKMQIEKFEKIVCKLKKEGINFKLRHISNSAGTMFYDSVGFDMVRCGLILYGYYPDNLEKYSNWELKPAMELKARVIMIKDIYKGESVSYGRIYKADRQKKVATVSIGYADGFSRKLQDKTTLLIGGKKRNILGRICMDLCVADISSDREEIKVGDEVVIIGSQGNENISVEDIARALDTINYEVICVIGRRIPRVYVENGKIKKYKNYLLK